MLQLPSKRTARIVRIALGAAVLGYGVYIADPGAPRLMVFGLTLFALPLSFQFFPWPLVRAYALWFGLFLVLQCLITPVSGSELLITRVPKKQDIRIYANETVLGVTGPQRITTDEQGFRAIGASTTEESTIDDEATWTHRLQLALATDLGRPVEVINTGVGGLRAWHHISTLRHILPLQPDLVLFLVGVNDWIYDTSLRFGPNPASRRMRFPDTLLGRTARMQFYRLLGTPAQAIVRHTAIADTPRSLEREKKVSWFPDAVSERYLADLREISETCRANHLTCVFLTQPNAYQTDALQDVKDLFWMTPPAASYTLTFESLIHIAQVYNRALVDFAKQHAHPLCDLAPRITPTTEHFWDEIHFTLAGSARVAELVTECVKPLVAASP